MALFTYKARDRLSQPVTGEIEGRGVGDVADLLFDRGLVPITIVERRARGPRWLALKAQLAGRPQLVDLVFFCRQMHSITKAGVPLHRGVRILADSIRHPVLRRVLGDMRRKIEEGRALSETMAAHRNVFPALMISMVRVGEHTGRLDEAFAELKRNLELEESTRRQMKSALRYPIMVLAAIALALVIVNLFVIPTFARVFSSFDAELPWFTRVLIATSEWTQAWWPHTAAVLVLAALGARAFLKTPHGAERWGRWSLRLPLVGDVLLKAAMSRFARTLGMCLRAGVALDQALQAVAGASDNRHFALRITAMRERIAQGKSLTATARESELFTPLVMQMILTGEETGRLDAMLDEAADFYEREVAYDVKMLGDYIEPVLLIVVSTLVLGLALGIFLPMWDLADAALQR